MTLVEVVDLSSDDDELGELDVKAVKLEPNLEGASLQQQRNSNAPLVKQQTSKIISSRQGSEESISFNASHSGGTPTSILDRGMSTVDDTSLSSAISLTPAPLCRQFWKAGSYNDIRGPKVIRQNGKNTLHVHPKFLHSNATSHKWAFGAVAELLDNAIDEIQNGATFVSVDKITNPRDGGSALLFQDDGGGMSPEAMRRCMSFGYTDKKAKSAIGRYGNGFKTSTMRLGADVIVFSRHFDKRVLTQSVGLLSYTFLGKAGYDRIVVPMVHYEQNRLTGKFDIMHGKEHFMSNLSMMLKWSPFSTEPELLKQFDDMGSHGTKVIIFNLWLSDDGDEELDYNTDPKDIRISGETKKADTLPAWKEVNEQHVGYTFRHSLRVYLSILYLRIPASFKIILRGEAVEHHNLADDLKYPDYILYKPQSGSGMEAQVVTTIGFLKEAPQVNIHGFCVYHKNRLILPFWQVVNYSDSRGRGVVGILEANFVEPTHNKQDFEKTSLFQKLEARLKDMTWEFWDLNCVRLGYQPKTKKARQMVESTQAPPAHKMQGHIFAPVGFTNATRKRSERPLSNSQSIAQQALQWKRKEHGSDNTEIATRQAEIGLNVTNTGPRLANQHASTTGNQLKDQEAMTLILENQKLRAQCSEYEKEEEELNLKVTRLKTEIEEVENKYSRLLSVFSVTNPTKQEKVA